MATKTKRAGQRARTPEYSVHPGVAKIAAWIDRLPAKTGHSLEEWLARVEEEGPRGEDERALWLKKACGFGTIEAQWIARRAAGREGEEEDPAAYLRIAAKHVEAMYAGPKAALRPIHDRLLELARSMGDDVRVCPCQTIVPLYRKHVFAQVKPTTRTRIDFGLCLKGVKPAGRLLSTGGEAKGDRITHRIAITDASEVDATVARWLRTAYERDA